MWDIERFRFAGWLIFLILCAFLLSSRLLYLFLADAHRFPINTVKISAAYNHISRTQLESVLGSYLESGFFGLSKKELEKNLNKLEWTDKATVERVWPDTLKITLKEKEPIAFWNDYLLTENGKLFHSDQKIGGQSLPELIGPENQQQYVLQIYQKLSKLLATYGLRAATLRLRENQAWDLSLTNGIKIRLGKRDLEQRLQRFCRAYLVIFANKPEQLSSVDLRYARGMAVQWKQQMGR